MTKPLSGSGRGAPTAEELAGLLGRAHGAFQALARRRAGASCEWKRYGRSSPWVMRVSEGERTLYDMTPQAGRFEVTVVLGERASQAALAGRVREDLHAAIRSARKHVEGRPVRVTVSRRADLAGVEERVAVKLRPETVSPPAPSWRGARGGRAKREDAAPPRRSAGARHRG